MILGRKDGEYYENRKDFPWKKKKKKSGKSEIERFQGQDFRTRSMEMNIWKCFWIYVSGTEYDTKVDVYLYKINKKEHTKKNTKQYPSLGKSSNWIMLNNYE